MIVAQHYITVDLLTSSSNLTLQCSSYTVCHYFTTFGSSEGTAEFLTLKGQYSEITKRFSTYWSFWKSDTAFLSLYLLRALL